MADRVGKVSLFPGLGGVVCIPPWEQIDGEQVRKVKGGGSGCQLSSVWAGLGCWMKAVLTWSNALANVGEKVKIH